MAAKTVATVPWPQPTTWPEPSGWPYVIAIMPKDYPEAAAGFKQAARDAQIPIGCGILVLNNPQVPSLEAFRRRPPSARLAL